MNLVFIYGAPAVGKLTVATELAKKTDYKVFHNHLTVDLVRSIFPFGTKESSELSKRFRIEMFEAAVKANINGVIFTYVYAKDIDDEAVKEIKSHVENAGGNVLFVLLKSNNEELIKRVTSESRKKYTKIQKVNELEDVLSKYELALPIQDTESLIIDNTNFSPEEVSFQIIKHFKL